MEFPKHNSLAPSNSYQGLDSMTSGSQYWPWRAPKYWYLDGNKLQGLDALNHNSWTCSPADITHLDFQSNSPGIIEIGRDAHLKALYKKRLKEADKENKNVNEFNTNQDKKERECKKDIRELEAVKEPEHETQLHLYHSKKEQATTLKEYDGADKVLNEMTRDPQYDAKIKDLNQRFT